MKEEERINTIVVVLGNKGYGKSHLIKNTIISAFKHVIVLDLMNEYDKLHNVITFTDIEIFYNVFEQLNKDSEKIIAPYNIRLAFKTIDEYTEVLYFLNDFEKYTLVIDECYKLANPRFIHPVLDNLVNLGRHYAINLVLSSRRPHQVSRLLTSQADVFVCLKIKEPRDIKFIEEYISSDFAEKVQALEKYKYGVCATSEDIKKFKLKPSFIEEF